MNFLRKTNRAKKERGERGERVENRDSVGSSFCRTGREKFTNSRLNERRARGVFYMEEERERKRKHFVAHKPFSIIRWKNISFPRAE